MPALFTRRTLPWPTPWGWLLLLGLVAVGAWLGITQAHAFFALQAPLADTTGRNPAVAVVEGFAGAPELDHALRIIKQRGYQRIYTSGGPMNAWRDDRSYAERAADYLAPRLPPGVTIQAVSSPDPMFDRTFTTAVWVRDYAAVKGEPMPAFDLISPHVHARRSRAMYRIAFGPEVQIGVVPAFAPGQEDSRWWRSSQSFKDVLGEAFAMVWVQCCFWPGPAGSHFEFPGLPRLLPATPAPKP